jgi:hypothetical protein
MNVWRDLCYIDAVKKQTIKLACALHAFKKKKKKKNFIERRKKKKTGNIFQQCGVI